MASNKSQRGFTLVELVITVTIAVILMTIAVPSFQDVMRANRLATSVNNIVVATAYAKSEAITRGLRVSVCPSTTINDPSPVCDVSGNWSAGWITFVDGGTRLIVDGSDQVLRVGQPDSSGVTISAPLAYQQGVSINAMGGSVDDADALLDGEIQVMVDGEPRCLDFNNLARAKIERAICQMD